MFDAGGADNGRLAFGTGRETVHTGPHFMATRLHVAGKHRGSLARYAAHFDFVEVAVDPADPHGPSTATLRRWRKEVPPTFEFCVLAPSAVTRLRPGAAMEAGLVAWIDAVNALGARSMLLRTPLDVTPADLHRERLAQLVKRLPRDVTRVVWEPAGVWEGEVAERVARKHGLTLAVDPIHEDVPDGPVAYLRLRTLGETRSFGAAALARIAESIGGRRDAYVVFDTASAARDGARLREAVEAWVEDEGGGRSRLVRPRGQLLVRDDEQE